MIVAYKKSELSHHGILGMRWGERNGPPYPLGAGDHSASEKKAGWRKSLADWDYKRKSKKFSNIHNKRNSNIKKLNKYNKEIDKLNKKIDKGSKGLLSNRLSTKELRKLKNKRDSLRGEAGDLMIENNKLITKGAKIYSKLEEKYGDKLIDDIDLKELGDGYKRMDEVQQYFKAFMVGKSNPKSGGFGFREIHESNGEKLAERIPPGYLDIKPEKELSKKELNKELDDFWKQVFQEAAEEEGRKDKYKSGGIGDRGAGDILSKKDEAIAEKVMNNIERNVQEIVNEIIGGKNNPKYPNREAMADKAAALRRQGLTNEQIAKKLGYESPSEISALLKDKNVAPKSGSYKSGSSVNMFTQKDNKQASAEADKPIDRGELARKQIKDLLDKGYTYAEIKDAFGLNSPADLVNVVPKLSPVSDKTINRKYNIDRGNVSVRDAQMNRHNYTTSDINAIVNRYNADKSLKDIISAEDKAKRERALKFIKGITEVSKTLYDASNEVDKWYKKFNNDKK